MGADEALLEACRQAPDDDAPRLVWADAVGGERGELVVIQCDLARGGLAPAEIAARRRRERELLAAHGATWADMSGLGTYWPRFEFRRGFVEAIQLEVRTFTEHGEALLRRAPLLGSLTAITLKSTAGDPGDELRRFLGSPALRRLSGLDVLHAGARPPLPPRSLDDRGNEAALLLAESGALAHLRRLGISGGGLAARGAHHLVASGALPRLERLWLRGADLVPEAILAVLGHAPRVTSLDLYGATGLPEIVPALPPVTALHLSGVGDEALAALGRSRAGATVEKLRLSAGALARCDGLGAFPRLLALDLHRMHLGDPERAAHELAACLPALRRLRLPSMPARGLRALARALGPQLEVLEVQGGEYHLSDGLPALVAGELLENPPTAEALL